MDNGEAAGYRAGGGNVGSRGASGKKLIFRKLIFARPDLLDAAHLRQIGAAPAPSVLFPFPYVEQPADHQPFELLLIPIEMIAIVGCFQSVREGLEPALCPSVLLAAIIQRNVKQIAAMPHFPAKPGRAGCYPGRGNRPRRNPYTAPRQHPC